MTTHAKLLQDVIRNPVTAVTTGNYGQNVVLPLLYSHKYPKRKVLVIMSGRVEDLEIYKIIYNNLSQKKHGGALSATDSLTSKVKENVVYNTVYENSFKIYRLLLENNLEQLKKFSLIFIDGISSGNLNTDLLFGLFLKRMGESFKNKRMVLSGRSVNYPFKDIFFHRSEEKMLSESIIIVYHDKYYPPRSGINRYMLNNFAAYIKQNLAYNYISGKVKGNVVVFLPGVGEIKYLQKQLHDVPDHRIITISSKNMTVDNINMLYLPAGNLILTTNAIHSVLGIKNVRIVFDSLQEKIPMVMKNGVTNITTTSITRQEADSRALLATPTDENAFSYVFRFTTEASFNMLERRRKESYAKEHLYSYILDMYEHDLDPISVLSTVAKELTIKHSIQDLRKYEYLENDEVKNKYLQIFGIIIERIYANFLSDTPYASFNQNVRDTYHFCFICLCAIVSEFRRGYFTYPRFDRVNEKNLSESYRELFKGFEGNNELLSYLNMVIYGVDLLKENYKNMKSKLITFCTSKSLDIDEVTRLFIKIKNEITLRGVTFHPGLLFKNDYIELSNRFAREYVKYRPESIFERRGNAYVYTTTQNTYKYQYDNTYTAVGMNLRFQSPQIIVFMGKSITKQNIDGFIRFSIPYETSTEVIESVIKLVPVENKLLLLDTSHLKTPELPFTPSLNLPSSTIAITNINWGLNEQFHISNILPEYFETKEDVIITWRKKKSYPLHRIHVNVLEYETYIPQVSNKEFEIGVSNIKAMFYDTISLEFIYVIIDTNSKIDRIHFDLAQPDLVSDQPVEGKSPDAKWRQEKEKLIEASIVPIFSQILVGYNVDKLLLEKNVGPFRKYPNITALTGLIDYLIPDDTEPLRVFERTPFYGELLFVGLRKKFDYYRTTQAYNKLSELYLDIIEVASGGFASEDEDWKNFMGDQTEARFQVQHTPPFNVNFVFMRYTLDFIDHDTEFWETLNQIISSASAWVVFWIEDPYDYQTINEKISNDYETLSYYGVIKFGEDQYFWVYNNADTEIFPFS